jgi:putative transposase
MYVRVMLERRDPELVQQAFRFALAPTAAQEQFLASCCGASRFWFNHGLALVKERLDRHKAGEDVDVPWSYKALCTAFRGEAIKDELAPWRSEVVTGSYQAGLEALGNALQNFSKARKAGRRVGFPRFRAKGRAHEAVIFQRPRLPDNRHVDLDRRLGPIRARESLKKLKRLLARDARARIMRATVQRANGGWVIAFTVERSRKQRRARRLQAAVGVDLGLAQLATLSTGDTVANSKPLRAALRALRRLQRQADRQRRANNPGNYLADGRIKPGVRSWARSRRMLRTEQRIAKLHERVANLRREQAHLLTTALVREFGVIGIETLQVKNLMANRRLARQIADVGWGMILAQLAYKTSWSHGSCLVAADRFHPSSRRAPAAAQ